MSARSAFAPAVLAAVLSAGVAALRVPQSGAAFCVLLGGAALLFGPVLVGLSAAPRPLPCELRVALLGLGFAALPLAKVAATLKAVTHHRPLGAVTFAAFSLALCGSALVVAARVLASSPQGSRARCLNMVWVLLAAAGPALLLARAASSPSLRGGVVDMSLGLGTGAVLLLVRWPPAVRRVLERVALPAWLATVLAGVVSAFVFGVGPAERSSAALSASITWLLR